MERRHQGLLLNPPAYREAFRAIDAEVTGEKLPRDLDFPTIDDGVEGMQFIETAVRSARRGARWVKFPA